MKVSFTHFCAFVSFQLKMTWLLIVLLILKSSGTVHGQTGCNPISTLTCDKVQVALPVSLSFNSSVAGTINDKNGVGTGFTMVDAYTGTRLTADGTPSNTNVPGYEASKLTLSSGRLQLVTNKGIALATNNNQINALGVKIDSRSKIRIETTLVNPYNGTSSQQGGLWFGLNDKTFLKLVVIANKVELRREINDVTSSTIGTSNPDQRITGTITDLNTKTVRLRLVVDPATNTAEGFYSTDGTTYLNAGAAYSIKTLGISGMGLTTSTAYGGIYVTHRNATTPVTYTFEDFGIYQINSGNTAPVFSPSNYSYSLKDNVALVTIVGKVSATDANGDALKYAIISGNTNSAFAINASTGEITVAKYLSYHAQNSYSLKVRATDAGGLSNDASVAINVTLGTAVPSFSSISWGTVASQPYPVYESQGEVVNGKLYTFGGFDNDKKQLGYWTPTNRAYVYNPVSNTWTSIASMPPMNGTNYGGVTHAGFTTDGNDIYFAGGYTSDAAGTGQTFGTKEVWKYIVAENRYVRLPDLPRVLASGQLDYLNGKLHHVAGFPGHPSRTVEVSDHYVLDLDNLAAGWKTLAPIPNRRNHPGSTVYGGKIYFTGGQHGNDHTSVPQKDLHVYDPDNNTWTKLADMPVPSGTTGRAHISSSVIVVGNRILVIGGETSHGFYTNMVSAYSPATNTWQNLTAFPRSIAGGVAAYLGSNIYYTGGQGSTKTTYKGIPGTTTAQQVASFTLINADTEQPIQTLTNGSTLNLATLPSRNLNIRANTNPSTVGSVVFNLSGTQSRNVTESKAPYALFGDNTAGDYYAWTPAVGSYTLKGTPYTASGGTGTAGTSLTVGFTVVDQAATTTTSSQTQAISQVKVYPNPSNGEDVHIEVLNIGQQKQVTLWLMDISGHLLEVKYMTTDEKGKASTKLSTGSWLQAGLYILQIQMPNGQIQRRLMVE